jgi:hypothetical protein
VTTVAELIPGQIVDLGTQSATFVAQVEHPLWPHLRLVVWRMHHDAMRWSHDALDPRQDVGDTRPSNAEERQYQLRRALLHRSQWGPQPESENP